MAENIKSRKYYRIHNGTDWDRMHFVTDANSVDANDGDTMETKVGAIKGITTSTSVTEEGYAADATTVAALNESLGGLDIRFNSETGKPEWKERGADSFNPFSCSNVSFHVKVTGTAFFNNRVDRIEGYFYYDADCTIIDGVLTQKNVSNSWYTYTTNGYVGYNPRITSIAISNFTVL